MAKHLIIIGIIFILVGTVWPWLSRLGLGHLPGDIYFRRKNFTFFFPITTGIVISLLLSFVFWLLKK